MTIQRSRRLRKKLHVDEFQELGFSISWNFAKGTDVETIDKTLDKFIDEVIEPNGLAFDGSGYLNWEGIVCLQKIGHCTEEHRQLLKSWLEKHGAQEIVVSELFDVWWD